MSPTTDRMGTRKLHFQEIVEIVRAIESGVTQPYQCRLADDNLYAVKGRGATARGLLAEVVCGELGRAIGLPIPDFCIGIMDDALLQASGDKYVASSLGAGECFASLWVEPTDVFSLSMLKRTDDRELAKLFAFDHWVRNGDRTLTPMGGNVNLMLNLATEQLVAFDHNLAFSPSYANDDMSSHVGRAAWRRAKDLVGFRKDLEQRMIAARQALPALLADAPEAWLETAPTALGEFDAHLSRVSSEEFWIELG